MATNPLTEKHRISEGSLGDSTPCLSLIYSFPILVQNPWPLLQLKLISFSICFAFARIQQLFNRPNNSFLFSFDLVGLKTTGDFKCIILEYITKCMLKNVLADTLCFCHPFLLTHEIEGASCTSSLSTPQPQSSQ